jgi:hypothetical protein
MTPPHSPIFGSHPADKQTNGSVLWSVIFNLRWRRKHGLASDKVSKQNSLHVWMTHSSSAALPTYLTGLVKIPGCFSHDWRNSFMSSRKIMPHTMSNPTGQLKRLQEAILKILSQKQSTTTWTTLPTSCLPRCSKRQLQKMYVGTYLTRIKPD